MIKKIVLLIILTISFINISYGIGARDTEWGLQHKVYPKNPAPGDFVFIDLLSYSFDISRANVSFFVDGKLIDGGTGLSHLTYKLPKTNRITDITIKAKEFDGKVFLDNIKIRPILADLIYEVVDPYKPVFYKGKSRHLSHSKVRFFAFPYFVNDKGKTLDPDTLVYQWYVNDKYKKYDSGIGKKDFLIDRTYGVPRETNVRVLIKSLDGKMETSKAVILKSEDPIIDIYYNEKVLPFNYKNVAKNSVIISDAEETDIIAVPYFFNDLNQSEIKWYLNDNEINLLANSDYLILNMIRNENNLNIPLNIGVNIENDDRPLLFGEKSILFKSSKKVIDATNERQKNVEENNKTNKKEETNFFGL